jgi:mRNA interferase MazF
MGLFAKGDVLITDLPYSDLSGVKRRPVLVVAAPPGLDLITCLITSKARADGYDIALTRADFSAGSLNIDSNARPCHLFALDPSIVVQKAGTLKPEKMKEVTNLIIKIMRS